jgi:hypothetical protein
MGCKRRWMISAALAALLVAPPALAQEEAAGEEAEEAVEADEAAEEAEEAAEEAEEAAEEEVEVEPEPEPEPEPEVLPEPEVDPAYEVGPGEAARVRIHAVTTRNTYAYVRLDVYDAETRQLVATGRTTNRAAGEPPLAFDLPPGLYKIVRSGESFDTRTDFATVNLTADADMDYVIVVEPGTQAFRGSGVVTDELPEGVTIAGVRIALNAGGTISLNQQRSVVGQTDGVHGLYGLFGNFSLVFDRDDHFLNVGSDLDLQLLDRPAASVYATTDRFSADALYAYNIQNPYIGPYVRGSFRTSVFPGYLFLNSGLGPEDQESAQVAVTREFLDGSSETRIFGTKATQDNLRVRLSDPFAPVILQQELGANLRALTANLILLDVDVATRLGWAFRQGIVRDRGLFAVDGDSVGQDILLREVDSYNTTGPTIGANATVTFARWLFGTGRVGIIAPVQNTDEAGDNFAERLLIDFAATAGFRVPILTDLLYASFDYTFRLERDGYLTDRTQVDQNLMGRVNVTLF